MNGHTDHGGPGGQRRPTALEMEVKFLRQEVKGLEQKVKSHQRELNRLRCRPGWEKFQDLLSTLEEDRIDDAISMLIEYRRQFNARTESLIREKGFQTNLRARFAADNPSPHVNQATQVNQAPHVKPSPLVNPSPHVNPLLQVNLPPHANFSPQVDDNKNHGIKRSATQPLRLEAQTEVRKQVRPRASLKSLKRPSLRHVGSARDLAAKFTGLFKKNRKDNRKERAADDGFIPEEEEAHSKQAIQEHPTQILAGEEWYKQQLHQPHYRNMKNKNLITGTHEQPREWKLDEAMEQYKKSQESLKESVASPRESSVQIVNEGQHTTKESREVEEEIVAAMEQEIMSCFPRNRGSVRQMNWPVGSRGLEDAFITLPRTDKFQLQSAVTQAKLHQSSASRADSRHSLPAPKTYRNNRVAQVYIPPANLPPASPPPTMPLPMIPERPPPPPPTLSTALAADDVFSRPRTPGAEPAPAQNHRLRRSIRRRSEPSPTPRFVSYRPDSPSPGGNGPLGATPEPSWMKE